MRNNVIDHRCLDVSALCLALHAQWMLSQVCLADSLPLASIATFGGRRSVRVQWPVFRTVSFFS